MYNIPEYVNTFGFYEIKIDTNGETGYIPYTVYEMDEQTITLYDLIKQILHGNPEEYTYEKIKEILKTICQHIYNFYSLMYLSLKFEHNDFKIDNIVVNPETLDVTIIDFGFARLDILLNNRKYQLFKRQEKEIERASGGQSNFYEYAHNIYKEFYLRKQADIERLTVWLKDVSTPSKEEDRHFRNKDNYDRVITEHFIPNIRYLSKLTLDKIKASNYFSRYREEELINPDVLLDCHDLFLFSLDEFKRCIDSLAGNEPISTDDYTKCDRKVTTVSMKGGSRNRNKKITKRKCRNLNKKKITKRKLKSKRS